MQRSVSRTERNLWTAFLGEAKANRLYTAFAMQAMEEDRPEVAQVFLEAAGAETIHAITHLRTLGEVRSTEENLLTVVRGEAYESVIMYPRMIREAEAEGKEMAARSFRIAWEREGHHRWLFEEALRKLGVPRERWAQARPSRPPAPAIEVPAADSRAAQEVAGEKGRIAALARVREVVFGAQDGLISTVALVSSIYGAVTENYLVIVAGLTAAVAGMISMAAGSFLSSKTEREVYEMEIGLEALELEQNPAEEMAELIEIYRREGLSFDDAAALSERVAADRQVWLNTMIEKELGLSPDLPGSPVKDALAMGGSFAVAALIPIFPYFFLQGVGALATSIGAAAVALFALGVGKSRFTHRHAVGAGIEILLIGTGAALLGYLLGTVLPQFLGAPAA